MARTHEKVRYTPKSKPEKLTPVTAAQGVENALKILEGRWKLVILFHLFGGKVLRFFRSGTRDPGDLPKDAHPATSPDGGRWRHPAHPPPSSSTESRIPPYAVGAETVPGA